MVAQTVYKNAAQGDRASVSSCRKIRHRLLRVDHSDLVDFAGSDVSTDNCFCIFCSFAPHTSQTCAVVEAPLGSSKFGHDEAKSFLPKVFEEAEKGSAKHEHHQQCRGQEQESHDADRDETSLLRLHEHIEYGHSQEYREEAVDKGLQGRLSRTFCSIGMQLTHF